MSRVLRVRVGLLCFALLLAGSLYGAAVLQRRVADRQTDTIGRLDELVAFVARTDAAVVGQVTDGDPETAEDYESTGPAAAAAFRGIDAASDEPRNRELLRQVRLAFKDWHDEARALVATLPGERSPAVQIEHGQTSDRLVDRALAMRAHLVDDAARRQRELTYQLVALALLVVAAIGGGGSAFFTRRDRERRRQDERLLALRDGQEEFAEAMQLVADEDEAHLLLKRHLERELDGADATVLNRNNSDNRLDATTPPPVDLEAALAQGAEPRSCLAVRSGRRHSRRAGEVALVSCELCGKRGRDTTCQPLLVSGEVIGAVHVGHPAPLDGIERGSIKDAVAQAAPVLGNLRTLAIAETRAATDPLTGLPNRRALQDTLKRMVATAQRGGHALGALAVDLDHFKQVNDVFGHEKGDEVLAAVGRVLAEGMRESDFAARAGGEEFVVLLPDTDANGAAVLAEKLRVAISRIEVPGVARTITASFGVAAYPSHAFDAATLLRKADRALYAAKEGGRDRTEVAALPVAEDARP